MDSQQIGNWILEVQIASGGMGDVYRARHKTLGTPAAVKVLRPQMLDAEGMLQRFAREAKIQAHLQHPNIARVLDYHEQEGRWYLVMEFLDHGSLTDRLREARGPVPIPQALAWVRQALAGLHYAHEHEIIHRDVKPDNLLLDAHGQVKVTDFGIARDLKLTRMTQTGMTMGTPHYMSPEQLLTPDQIDERSDVYAMGVVLYELLAGRPPFEGSSFFAVSKAKIEQDPPPLSSVNPLIPPQLVAIVHQAMARDRQQRFASCQSFLRTLDDYEAGRPAGPPPIVPIPTMLQQNTVPFQQSTASGSAYLQGVDFPSSTFEPPQPRPHRGWQAASVALVLLLVVAAALAWQFLPGGSGEQHSDLSKAVQEAHKAEAAADATVEAAKKVEEVAENAEATAQGILDKPSLESGPGKAGAAQAAIEQAREAAESLHEGEDSTAEAYQAAEKAAQTAGVDTSTPASDRPQLVKVLPKDDAAARQAARDAVEVARLASFRAQNAAGEADAAVQQAESRLEAAQERLRDLQGQMAGQGEEQLRQMQEQMANQGAAQQEQLRQQMQELEARQLQATQMQQQLMARGMGQMGPLPEQPTVAVLAHGDPVMAASFEEELERRLSRAKLDVRDEHNSPEVSQRLRAPQLPAADELAPELLGSGFHVLVMISVEEGERRHLELRGQRGNAVGARLRVNAYNLANKGAPIGRGWSELVEYTELSAGAKAKRALLKESTELVTAIRDAWQKVRPT